MATATRWYVDDETEVTLDPSTQSIVVRQHDQEVWLTHDSTDSSELVDALLAAIIESGRDFPDLSRHGYKREDEE